MSRAYEIINITDDENDSGDNFFCNLCGFSLSTLGDFQSQARYLCCQECFLEFGESRKQEWDEGWRPKKSDLKKYINNRKRLINKSA